MTREPRRLVVRPAAERDIAEAFRWYEGRSPGLGVDDVFWVLVGTVIRARASTEDATFVCWRRGEAGSSPGRCGRNSILR
ncbi:MAG TPA: hypothetical protein VFN74_03570 [Chloroflexota bacterium]|nr:hypothetical protein [Chloroflexota bacterium]